MHLFLDLLPVFSVRLLCYLASPSHCGNPGKAEARIGIHSAGTLPELSGYRTQDLVPGSGNYPVQCCTDHAPGLFFPGTVPYLPEKSGTGRFSGYHSADADCGIQEPSD